MKNIIFLTFLSLSFNVVVAQSFVKQKAQKTEPHTSEEYTSLTFNGSWCWFSDPRAVYYEGQHKRTYTGWVDNYGDVHVGYYDHDTKEIASKVLYDNLEIDDHNNPSILFDEEGRLLVFFNTHSIGVKPLYLAKALGKESIESWAPLKELFLNDEALKDMGRMHHTYTNPVKLSGENGRIYIFWRGVDGKPSYSFSDNNGDTWSKGKIFFMPERKYAFRRPYTKVYSDGIDKIHFTVTDGHPRKENENNIYYFCYQKGALYKANGTKIKDLEEGPLEPTDLDLVYDAKQGKAKAWNWDIAQDENGNPVIAYVKFPNDSNHIYCYAKWDDGQWNNYDLINSGKWFPESLENKVEREPNYSGGMSIDHENTNTLYLSVNRDSIFEIEKWETKNGGKTWKVEALTSRSVKNNVRPFAVRNAKEGNPVQVLWMQNTKYHHYSYHSDFSYFKDTDKGFKDRFHSAIKMNVLYDRKDNVLDKENILGIMRQAADWHLENPRKYNRTDWHYGAFSAGLRAMCELTGENRYINEMYNVGQVNNWSPMNTIFHADRLTIVDNWIWLYGLYKKPEMIDRSRWAFDIHLARRYKENTDVRFQDNPYRFEWWTWCDALFMAPPSFIEMAVLTGEDKYLQYADTQWWKTSDYMYSPEDSLYFRDDRYFEMRSDNNKKIFWSRGNGWVISGLARILEDMPGDYKNRDKFEQQYKEMAHKLLSLQSEDGLWRVSLLDPEYLDIGESSGSSFFTHALAWGINNDLIDKKYQAQVEKAWKALCNNVNNEGRLGYVQQVAGSPYPFYDHQSHVYATGAFLLAGKEMYLMK